MVFLAIASFRIYQSGRWRPFRAAIRVKVSPDPAITSVVFRYIPETRVDVIAETLVIM